MGEGKFTRCRVKNIDKGFSGSPRAKSDRWQLIIERDVPNPDYLPRDEATDENGNKVPDTRTAKQKRRSKVEQRTRMYDGPPVIESKAKDAARTWLDQVNAEAAEEERAAGGGNVTVAEYIDAFLARWERNVEASTVKDYRNVSKRIKKAFQDVELRNLTGKAITAWVDDMHRSGLSLATQRKSYNLLNLICRQAVKADDLDANPCDKANPPKVPKADPNPLTNKSRETLFTKLLDGTEPTPLITAVNIGVFMGLREGEICALKWKHVDLENMRLQVCQAIGRGTGKNSTYVKTPKNRRSKRNLPIPGPLVSVLTSRCTLMQTELDSVGVAMDEEQFAELYVIGAIDGSYQNPNTLSRQWKNVAETFNLVGTKGRICTFYEATRHSFATEAVARKNDVESVAAFMGHDPTMTMRVYADATEQGKRNVADSMGEAYGK